jgi:hypothetical protein
MDNDLFLRPAREFTLCSPYLCPSAEIRIIFPSRKFYSTGKNSVSIILFHARHCLPFEGEVDALKITPLITPKGDYVQLAFITL